MVCSGCTAVDPLRKCLFSPVRSCQKEVSIRITVKRLKPYAERGAERSLSEHLRLHSGPAVFCSCFLLSSALQVEVRFSANIRHFVPHIASHVGGEGARAEFSSGLYKQPEHLAAVRAQTVTSHKLSANLYMIWKVERTGSVCELFSLNHLIQVSLVLQNLQVLQTPVFPNCILVLVHASGSWGRLTLTWQKQVLSDNLPVGTCIARMILTLSAH